MGGEAHGKERIEWNMEGRRVEEKERDGDGRDWKNNSICTSTKLESYRPISSYKISRSTSR